MATGAVEEVEIKLELSAAAFDALAIGDLFAGKPTIIRQHATYFDTPDHGLANAGFSLRIRKSDGKRLQTIKRDAGSAAGLFVRQEWEREVRGDRPVLDEATPIAALVANANGNASAGIMPLFSIDTERRLWTIDGVEIALDRARIVAGERETSFYELEIEQKDGDFAQLFALAHRLVTTADVRLSVLSKAQRGYRLLGAAPVAARAAPIMLAAPITAQAAFAVIARACMVQFRLNEALLLATADPVALHQARVALRRLRSALSLNKALLADSRFPGLCADLRWLAARLGKARDLDVLIARAGDNFLREQLCKARAGAYRNAGRALRSVRARTLMIDLAAWIAIGDWRAAPETRAMRDLSARCFAVMVLDRQFRRLRTGGRNLANLDDRARHEVRKTAKKLHYAAGFYASLFDGKRERRRHKRFVAAVQALLDQLGALNDLATVPRLLAALDLVEQPQAAMLLGAEAKPGLLAAAAVACEALLDRKRFWR
jgi:inorganic triphosphatase YgiF